MKPREAVAAILRGEKVQPPMVDGRSRPAPGIVYVSAPRKEQGTARYDDLLALVRRTWPDATVHDPRTLFSQGGVTYLDVLRDVFMTMGALVFLRRPPPKTPLTIATYREARLARRLEVPVWVPGQGRLWPVSALLPAKDKWPPHMLCGAYFHTSFQENPDA
jgi:hypothetical protein